MHAKLLQSCLTVQPHRWQPTRFLCPQDSLGKNTAVGCHFLLSFKFLATVTTYRDLGAQENKICHCFHFSPFYLSWNDGTRCLILVFWMLSFKLQPCNHDHLYFITYLLTIVCGMRGFSSIFWEDHKFTQYDITTWRAGRGSSQAVCDRASQTVFPTLSLSRALWDLLRTDLPLTHALSCLSSIEKY